MISKKKMRLLFLLVVTSLLSGLLISYFSVGNSSNVDISSRTLEWQEDPTDILLNGSGENVFIYSSDSSRYELYRTSDFYLIESGYLHPDDYYGLDYHTGFLYFSNGNSCDYISRLVMCNISSIIPETSMIDDEIPHLYYHSKDSPRCDVQHELHQENGFCWLSNHGSISFYSTTEYGTSESQISPDGNYVSSFRSYLVDRDQALFADKQDDYDGEVAIGEIISWDLTIEGATTKGSVGKLLAYYNIPNSSPSESEDIHSLIWSPNSSKLFVISSTSIGAIDIQTQEYHTIQNFAFCYFDETVNSRSWPSADRVEDRMSLSNISIKGDKIVLICDSQFGKESGVTHMDRIYIISLDNKDDSSRDLFGWVGLIIVILLPLLLYSIYKVVDRLKIKWEPKKVQKNKRTITSCLLVLILALPGCLDVYVGDSGQIFSERLNIEFESSPNDSSLFGILTTSDAFPAESIDVWINYSDEPQWCDDADSVCSFIHSSTELRIKSEQPIACSDYCSFEMKVFYFGVYVSSVEVIQFDAE